MEMYRNDAEFLIIFNSQYCQLWHWTEQTEWNFQKIFFKNWKNKFMSILAPTLTQLSYSNQSVMLFSEFLEKLEMMDMC